MDSEPTTRRRSAGFGWFYLGALIGAVLAAGAVVVATELTQAHGLRRLRQRRGMRDSELLAREMDIVEGLTHVVSEGFGAMADAVTRLSDGFSSQRRETIRYGLEAEGGSGHVGSSHGWYYGDEDDDYQPAVSSAGSTESYEEDAFGAEQPLPS